MTATLNDVAKKKAGEPSAEQQAAAELVRLAKEQGLSLTGPDGLLKQLTRTVLAFLAAAARAGGAAELSWHVTFNHDGKVNRLSYRSDNERTPGWYAYLDPAADEPGRLADCGLSPSCRRHIVVGSSRRSDSARCRTGDARPARR
jgi:hypothetical protein